jgi:hypothetical protein
VQGLRGEVDESNPHKPERALNAFGGGKTLMGWVRVSGCCSCGVSVLVEIVLQDGLVEAGETIGIDILRCCHLCCWSAALKASKPLVCWAGEAKHDSCEGTCF